MGEIHLPEDLASLPVFVVVGGSPAAQALLRMCRHPPLRPGQIVPVSEEEMCSLREDVLVVALENEPKKDTWLGMGQPGQPDPK